MLEESVTDAPLAINGPVIDLFDPLLPILNTKKVQPGEQAFLYDLNRLPNRQPQVLAAASRVTDEKINANGYTFLTKSPDSTKNVMRIYIPQKPASVTVTTADGTPLSEVVFDWDAATYTGLLQFTNAAVGRRVNIVW